MKNSLIAMVLIFISTTLFSQEPYKMKVGDQLVYHVEAGESEYDFIATPTQLNPKGISFDYKMTAPANVNGTINMNAEALKKSFAMYNQFSGGKVNLSKEISVFVSKSMMEAAKKGSVTLYLNGKDGVAENFITLKGMDSPTNGSTYLKIKKEVNGKLYSLDGPILENEDGSKGIRFTDGGGYPFITYMNIDFKIYLTKIIRAK